MKIVAFLQNPWFREGTPDNVIQRYRDDQRFHRKILLLSMSGKRLHKAFGDLYNEIHWDNTNWRAVHHAAGKLYPDFKHMANVVSNQEPDMIIAVGNQAWDSCIALLKTGVFRKPCVIVRCHHPNARHHTQDDLNEIAQGVRNTLKNRQAGTSPVGLFTEELSTTAEIVTLVATNSLKWGFLTAKEAGFPLGSFGAGGISVLDHKFYATMKIDGKGYDYEEWIRGKLPENNMLDEKILHAVNKMKERAARCVTTPK